MHIKSPVLAVLLSIISINVDAYEVLVGIEANSQAVWVEDKSRGPDEIAKVDRGINYQPSAGVRTSTRYFKEGGNWGYHYQLDYYLFDINKQELPGVSEVKNVGTGLKGYSVVAVPVAYYHFNRGKPEEWSYKAGLGVGLGYLNLRGDFRITDNSHPEYNQVKDVSVTGFDLAVGVYFEAAWKNHIIVIQNYGPTLSDTNYEYLQHNVVIAYRYAFRFPKV